MQTSLQRTAQQTLFHLYEVPESYHTLLRKWDYARIPGGFALAFPAETPGVEQIYRNFSQSIEAILLQALGLQTAPWENALRQTLALLQGQDIDWFLGGSAALAVRGVQVQPRDVDLVSDAPGALRISELLRDFLFQPMTRYTDWICDWKGHAFLGARVEWVGGVHAEIDAEGESDFGPIAAGRLETFHWQGHALRVAPLEMQYQVSLRRGLVERAAAIRAVMETEKS